MTRSILYVAAPVRPNEEEIAAQKANYLNWSPSEVPAMPGSIRAAAFATRANVDRAMRWLSWLRKSFPETTFIAPWIADILARGSEDRPELHEAGLVDACAVIERCDGIVLCGPRISSGIQREMEHGQEHYQPHRSERHGHPFQIHDLTRSGAEPPGFPPGERPTAKTFADYMTAWAMVMRARGLE